MGYRMAFTTPSAEIYSQIIQRYMTNRGLTYKPEILLFLLSQYDRENREMKACEPRDLVERCLDICKYQNLPKDVTLDIMKRAWDNYFGVSA